MLELMGICLKDDEEAEGNDQGTTVMEKTISAVDQMDAGREMDAVIAEKVFAWRWIAHAWKDNPTYRFIAPPTVEIGDRYSLASGLEPLYADWDRVAKLPKYSTDIADAWQIVEKLRLIGWNYIQIDCDEDLWGADFAKLAFTEHGANQVAKAHSTARESAPLAIGRAALKAMILDEPRTVGESV
jgi:hypothetical protein